jgi:hypothetical protein
MSTVNEMEESPFPGYGIASLLVGLIALFGAFAGGAVALPFAVAGAVLGRRSWSSHRALAVTGLVQSFLSVIVAGIFTLLVLNSPSFD